MKNAATLSSLPTSPFPNGRARNPQKLAQNARYGASLNRNRPPGPPPPGPACPPPRTTRAPPPRPPPSARPGNAPLPAALRLRPEPADSTSADPHGRDARLARLEAALMMADEPLPARRLADA